MALRSIRQQTLDHSCEPRRAKILLIEDDVELARTLQEGLGAAGYETRIANDGLDAARLYAENMPDLVVTDIFMPNKDGLDVIVDLRRTFPCVKLVAMSGAASKENLLHTASLIGASQSILKPFSPDRIVRVVAEVLHK